MERESHDMSLNVEICRYGAIERRMRDAGLDRWRYEV